MATLPDDETSQAEPDAPSAMSDRSGVTDAVRAQILATEHWSLLATRSQTWSEIFNRASMFITVLSAAVVALALVAQASDFGPEVRLFALVLLSIVLFVGVTTFVRLGEANSDDIELVIGMNRLRHGYLELAPELEPYFTTSHHDDHASILQSYGRGYRRTLGRFISGTPALVGTINVVLAAVIGGLAAAAADAGTPAALSVGAISGIVFAAFETLMVRRAVREGRDNYQPRFPR